MNLSRRRLLRSLGLGAAALPYASGVGRFLSQDPEVSTSLLVLNGTGNAEGPSEGVRAAMREAMSLINRFPDVEYYDLVSFIAEYHRVPPSQVLIGCGSTEILRSAVFALLGSGKRLVMARPTFDAIDRYARAAGAEVVQVPLDREFAHDLGAMRAAINEATGLVYICNPNNPTGALTLRKDLEAFIGGLPSSTCVIVDEAYHHFVGPSPSYASLVDRPINDPRVIVTRTFSKAYALAGLRIGYGISAAKTVELLRRHQLWENVNGIAVRAAVAALADSGGLATTIKHTSDARQEFENQAVARMLRPLSSHTNFVMLDTGHPASEVIQHFEEHGILIGPPYPTLDTFVRVSLGRSDDMRRFWQVWDLKMFHPEAH